jgi:hypothetical protein
LAPVSGALETTVFEDGGAGNLAVIGALALRRNQLSWKY